MKIATATRKYIDSKAAGLTPLVKKRLKSRAEAEVQKAAHFDASRYRTDAGGYIEDLLGWIPWAGTDSEPGQLQVVQAYDLAVAQQLEKHAYEQGELSKRELKHWKPGEIIQNWIRVESGNLVGKTKIASGLFSHFFDCFSSIIYTFAPSWPQINNLLWKEIRSDRRTSGRPGRVHEKPELRLDANRFAIGRAPNDSGGTGIEQIQGQHHPYLMFILDEAEGIPSFVYDALEGMDTGIVVIVLLLANPRTRASKFHSIKGLPYVANFRISTLTHPNVRTGRQVIPGAATRDWVIRRLENEDYCEEVDEHDEDEHTFEVEWLPDKIFRPKALAFWRILGIAPENLADDTFCPVGRYEAAQRRDPYEGDAPTFARFGVDCARYGTDNGTLYIRHAGKAWRAAQFSQKRETDYYRRIKRETMQLVSQGVLDVQVRIDAGGGYGGGIVDLLEEDGDIEEGIRLTLAADANEAMPPEEKDHPFFGLRKFDVVEAHFNSRPYDQEAFFDLATEIYYHAAEALKTLRLDGPPSALEAEICERPFVWRKKAIEGISVDVKKLRDKEEFRKAHQRSPDDGDGLSLCLAPDYVFETSFVDIKFLSV